MQQRLLGVGVGLAAVGLAVWLWATPTAGAAVLAGVIDGPDGSRRPLPVRLAAVTDGLAQITDIQALPKAPEQLIVLTKAGVAWRVDARNGRKERVFDQPVLTRSEQGLLGLAFHPKYPENKRFFINYSADGGGGGVTRVAEWRGDLGPGGEPKAQRVILEVAQPWPNHNAGQLAFGPDGFLYVGLGDGGAANDPQGHGQNLKTLLGAMLRLDVDDPQGGPYRVPADNPFLGRADARPEIWAFGLRNPWRYSFAPDGRLVVADVGQNAWEEITVVGKGENHGWSVREAGHCFPPKATCSAAGLVDPVYAYPHGPLGNSITGGRVYQGARVPALKGRYVFADFASGRLWALDLPAPGAPAVPTEGAFALGRFPIQPATFGEDGAGELYVGDYAGGVLYRIIGP